MAANYELVGFGIYALLLCLGLLLTTTAWVMMALWIHRDAENKAIENSALWAVLAGLTGVIGLIIYFAVNSQKRKNPQYPIVDGVPRPPVQRDNKKFMVLFTCFMAGGVLLMVIGIIVMIGTIFSMVPYYYY